MGLLPAAASVEAVGAFAEIEETRLTGTAASVTFSGLGGRRFLHLSAYVIHTAGAQIRITLNGDTGGTQYGGISNRVAGAAWTGSFSNSQAFINISNTANTQPRVLEAWIAKMSASIEAAVIFREAVGAAVGTTAYSQGGGRWKNTADTITSLEVFTSASTMAADTVLHLEGRT